MHRGKNGRGHQAFTNRVPPEDCFPSGDLEAEVAAFIDHYNHHRHHESLDEVTPADA